MRNYRGKRKDNGEWVKGWILNRGCVPNDSWYMYVSDGLNIPQYYLVDPETVGQCTGLKDTNGVDEWEGDILKLDEGASGTWPITWDNHGACFMCGEELLANVRGNYKTEIIGNIHDNKGEQK